MTRMKKSLQTDSSSSRDTRDRCRQVWCRVHSSSISFMFLLHTEFLLVHAVSDYLFVRSFHSDTFGWEYERLVRPPNRSSCMLFVRISVTVNASASFSSRVSKRLIRRILFCSMVSLKPGS